jgi:hypothetical protein
VVADRQKRCLSDDGHFGDEPSRCRWLQAPATTEVALQTPVTGITTMVLSGFFVLKRQVRDNLLRTAPGIGSPRPSCESWMDRRDQGASEPGVGDHGTQLGELSRTSFDPIVAPALAPSCGPCPSPRTTVAWRSLRWTTRARVPLRTTVRSHAGAGYTRETQIPRRSLQSDAAETSRWW